MSATAGSERFYARARRLRPRAPQGCSRRLFEPEPSFLVDYGTTYVAPECGGVLRQRGLGELEASCPRLVWNFQNVYTIRKP